MRNVKSVRELMALAAEHRSGTFGEDGKPAGVAASRKPDPDQTVMNALAELSKQTGKMTEALIELHKIIGNSLVSLAVIVDEQSKSIDALAVSIAKISKAPEPAKKPRSLVFDVRREAGRIKQITAKEV